MVDPHDDTGALTARRDRPELSGLRKAATFLLALDADTASKVMRNFSDDQLQAVSAEMARLREVSRETIDLVFAEYEGEGERIRVEPMLEKILQKTLGVEKARLLFEQIRSRNRESAPFQALQALDADTLAKILEGEHPQVLALVTMHLDSKIGLQILTEMDEDLRYDVVRRMATTEQLPREMIRQVDEALSVRAAATAGRTTSGRGHDRFKNIAEMLNLADPSVSKNLLDRLGKDVPDAAAEIQSMMFVFEDLLKIEDRDMQKVLGSIEKDLLPLALKTASDELSEKLLSNMSKRARETLEEEMEMLGPKPLAEVEGAQKEIVEIVRKMVDDGEIQINRGGEEMV